MFFYLFEIITFVLLTQFLSKSPESQLVQSILWYSHVVERRCGPETALCSPGQSMPGISGQVTTRRTSVLLILLILKSVEAHEGQLLEKRRHFHMTPAVFDALEVALFSQAFLHFWSFFTLQVHLLIYWLLLVP